MTTQKDKNEPEHRSKLEDQLIEILMQADRPPTYGERARATLRRARRSLRRNRFRSGTSAVGRFGLGTWLLVCAVAAILALVIGDSSPFFSRLLAIVAVVAFGVPIVMRWRRPDETDTKRWRGRDIDLRDRPPDVLDDFRRRFRRPPKR
ncbi:MAG: hypothetical protein ACRDJW_17035 [Thermomicrobiales bacterium]